MLTLEELCAGKFELPPADVCERCEDLGDTLHTAARSSIIQVVPANSLGDLAAAPSSAVMEKIARVLNIRLQAVSILRPPTRGVYIEPIRAIYLDRTMGATDRLAITAHEIGHERRPRAPHSEICYLAMCLTIPRLILAELREGRPICASSLVDACPWPVPWVVAELRAEILGKMVVAA